MFVSRLRHLLPGLAILLVLPLSPAWTTQAVTAAGQPTESMATSHINDDHRTPISLDVRLDAPPALNETASVAVIVSSAKPAPGTHVVLGVSDGVEISGDSAW